MSGAVSWGKLMKLCCGIAHKGIQDALHKASLCSCSLWESPAVLAQAESCHQGPPSLQAALSLFPHLLPWLLWLLIKSHLIFKVTNLKRPKATYFSFNSSPFLVIFGRLENSFCPNLCSLFSKSKCYNSFLTHVFKPQVKEFGS